MDVLLAYDLENEESIIKETLKDQEFLDYWVDDNGKTHPLPESTLIHLGLRHTSHAKTKFFNVISNLNEKREEKDKIKVTKFIALQCDFNKVGL